MPETLLKTATALCVTGLLASSLLHAQTAPEARPWRVPADPIAVQMPKIERGEVLGMKVWSNTNEQAALFEASLVVPVSPSASNELPLLMAGILRNGGVEGAEGPDFLRRLARQGLALEILVAPDILTVTVRSEVDRPTPALELLSDLALAPAYPETTFFEVSQAFRARVAARKTDPLQVALDQLRSKLFPEHRYAAQMDPRAIAATGIEQLREAHRQQFCPNNAMLAVSGRLEPQALRATLETAFEGWARCEPITPAPASSPEETGVRFPAELLADRFSSATGRRFDPHDLEQTVISKVIAHHVDAAVKSRVASPYRAGASTIEYRGAGLWWAWAEGPDPAALDIVWKELTRVRQGGLSRSEINAAINALTADMLEQMGDVPTIVLAEVQSEMRGFAGDRIRRQLEMLRGLSPARVGEEVSGLLARAELIDVVCGPDVRAEVGKEEAPSESAEDAMEPMLPEPAPNDSQFLPTR